MIQIKLHGTSGSGKSTLARDIMAQGRMWNCYGGHSRLVWEGHRVDVQDMKWPIFILGKYNSQCGGCDTLTAVEQIDLLHKYAPFGHVFYEGLLASEYYGKLGEASEMYGDNHIFAFLYTPIEVCIQRVKDRRLEKGNTKPLNESNTRGRIKKIERLQWRLEHEFYRVTRVLNWERPVQDIMELFRQYDQFTGSKSDALLGSGERSNPPETATKPAQTMVKRPDIPDV